MSVSVKHHYESRCLIFDVTAVRFNCQKSKFIFAVVKLALERYKFFWAVV